MNLTISNRLKPFSHKKGQSWILPGSNVKITIYPCKLIFEDLSQNKKLELKLELYDFYESFTQELDFDKKILRVFGETKDGYIEYEIKKIGFDLSFKLQRFDKGSLNLIMGEKVIALQVKDSLNLYQENQEAAVSQQKISFGINKKQKLERIFDDLNLHEILPYIYRLGDALKLEKTTAYAYPLDLAKILYLKHDSKEKTQILKKLISGFYDHGFIPSLSDEKFQGISFDKALGINPLILNQMIKNYLQDSLVFFEDSTLHILKGLPNEFNVGRAVFIPFKFGHLHLEWTKGFLRQMILVIEKPCEFEIDFGKEVKVFRVKSENKIIKLKKAWACGTYYFDNFKA